MGDPLTALKKSSIVDLAAVREAVHGPLLPQAANFAVMHKAAQGLLLRAVQARQRSPISRNLGSFAAFDLGDDIRLDSLVGETERDPILAHLLAAPFTGPRNLWSLR